MHAHHDPGLSSFPNHGSVPRSVLYDLWSVRLGNRTFPDAELLRSLRREIGAPSRPANASRGGVNGGGGSSSGGGGGGYGGGGGAPLVGW